MERSRESRTLGVVVVHEPDRAVFAFPAVRELAPQVDELLIVGNGCEVSPWATNADAGIRSISFPTNRGTAAAWNAALRWAQAGGYDFLYILDQDSVPSSDAVRTALAQITAGCVAAVVQPASRDRLRLVPFPWNTVASGSLYEVKALRLVGGFDERLFVDEVDHEVLDRLMRAGYQVRPLARPTIDHHAGSPRPTRLLGQSGWTLGHSVQRQRLRGYSTGLVVRRHLRRAPGIAARLLLREAVLAAKDLAAAEGPSARALLSGLVAGVATSQPPARAAERSCPYCEGPLLGQFAAVPDWIFGAGCPGDVYRCPSCGALAAGMVPGPDEVASWYADYYTHAVEPERSRMWSRFWPTPRRRRELEQLRWYFSQPGSVVRFLEVGTGSGALLVQFAQAGWDVVGQDLDPKAGDLARDRGIQVHQCPISDLVGREKPFDLIGLTHVLEHATDPAALLRACSDLLTPNGRICVIAPNARSLGRWLFGRWWFGLDQPRHLAIPTLKSLDRLTSRLGLQTVRAECASANGAVILGGSLTRPFDSRLPPGKVRRAARFSTALLGQAMGRAASLLNRGLGEEVVWVGQRARS